MKNLITVLLCIAFMLFCVSAMAATGTKTWTDDADFDEGILDDVNHDAPNNDQLQVTVDISPDLPFIWVANSGESTVSKINTLTGDELGRYRTGPGTGFGENPSRTTVDLNGDVWVGNRSSATATKIALKPFDQNGDGVITTSTGAGDVLAWGTDEAVLLRVPADSGPRALAVDAWNNVWIGGSGGQTMNYHDGQTGAILKSIHIGRSCYGALIDGNNRLWISNDGNNSITRIDNPNSGAGGPPPTPPYPTTPHVRTFISTPYGWCYGMGISTTGFIYFSGWQNARLNRLDPSDNSIIQVYTGSYGNGGRGVCVGADGDVWMVHSNNNRATRHDPNTLAWKASVPIGGTPTGIALDSAGKIWVTNYDSHSIMRIDPATNSVDLTQGGHTYPYNYSDMTGAISGSITTSDGSWTVQHDSGFPGTEWGLVDWTANTPVGTAVNVAIRAADNLGDFTPALLWTSVSDGDPVSGVSGRYVEMVVNMEITSGMDSPSFFDVFLEFEYDDSAVVIMTIPEAAAGGYIDQYCYLWLKQAKEYQPVSPFEYKLIDAWNGWWVIVHDDIDLLFMKLAHKHDPVKYPSFPLPSSAEHEYIDGHWYLMCSPLIPPDSDFNAMFGDDVGDGEYNNLWDIYKWDYAADLYTRYDGPGTGFPPAIPGRGFWFKHKSGEKKVLTIDGTGVMPTGDYYEIKLPSNGSPQTLHMVGNPFWYNTQWQECMVRVPMTDTLPLGKVAASSLEDAQPWYLSLKLQARDIDVRDTFNRAGVVANYNGDTSFFNAVDMKAPGDYVSLALQDPSDLEREPLAYDFRPSGKSVYTWEVKLSTTYEEIDVVFTIDNFKDLPENVTARLSSDDLSEDYVLSSMTSIPITLHSGTTKSYTLTIEDIPLEVSNQAKPDAFGLSNIMPNPFNPTTSIAYNIGSAGYAKLNIYNLSGQLIETLVDSYMDQGSHTITWNASGQASGVYLVELRSGLKKDVRKVTLMK